MKKTILVLLCAFVLMAAGCGSSRTISDNYVWNGKIEQGQDFGFFTSKAQQDMRTCRFIEKYAGVRPTSAQYSLDIQNCMESQGYKYIGENK